MKFVFLTLILITASKQAQIDFCRVIPGSAANVKGDVFNDGDTNLQDLFNYAEPDEIFETALKFKAIIMPSEIDQGVTMFALKRMEKKDVTETLMMQNEDISCKSYQEKEFLQCQIDDRYIYVAKSLTKIEGDGDNETKTKNLIAAQDTYESLCSGVGSAEGGKIPLFLQNGFLAGDQSLLIEHFNKGKPLIHYSRPSVGLELCGVKLAIREIQPDFMTPQRLKIMMKLSLAKIVPTFRGCVWNGRLIYLVQDEMKQELLSDDFTEKFKSFKLWQKAEFFVKLAQIIVNVKNLGYSIRELTASNVMVDESLSPKLTVIDWIVPLGTLDTIVVNEAYAAPWRKENNPVDDSLDVYSLCTIILVLTGGKKEEIFRLDTDLPPKVKNWGLLRTASPIDRFKGYSHNMNDAVEESWGPVSKNIKSMSDLGISNILIFTLTSQVNTINSDLLLQNLENVQKKFQAEDKLIV